jgi:hypothetical protein
MSIDQDDSSQQILKQGVGYATTTNASIGISFTHNQMTNGVSSS